MYLLLLLLSVVTSRPLIPRLGAASTCNEIPAGSNMTDHNGDNIVFRDPIVADKCETETNSQGQTRSRQFNCSGTTAFENYYAGSTCTGAANGANPVTLSGACATAGCAGYTEMQYQHSGSCQGKPDTTTTNEYMYWNPSGCNYNMTQTCANGLPSINFFNNSACTGTARHTMTSGVCNNHGGHGSAMFTVTDNPCS
eukprot:349181_1